MSINIALQRDVTATWHHLVRLSRHEAAATGRLAACRFSLLPVTLRSGAHGANAATRPPDRVWGRECRSQLLSHPGFRWPVTIAGGPHCTRRLPQAPCLPPG